MTRKRIIFLSYGSDSAHLRTVFSILSFISWLDKPLSSFKILVYSDNPGYLKSFLEPMDIVYFTLTSDIIQLMLNNTGFNHRLKVEVISRTFTDYIGDDILFLDSDTFFIKNPALILDNFKSDEYFMHKREYTLYEGVEIFGAFGQSEYPTNFLNYIKDKKFDIGAKKKGFSGGDYSWNSGVIGLTFKRSVYMKDILRLTDDFYLNTKWFLSEQLAFSLVLSKTAEIKPTDDIIIHYWGGRQKNLMDTLILTHTAKFKRDLIPEKAYIKSLTKKWNRYIQADLVIEQAIIAFTQGTWWFFAKKIIVIVFKYPTFLWRLFKELKILKM